MIYPWQEMKVNDNVETLIKNTIDSGYILEIQNPVLSSNGVWGSIFYGKTKLLSPEVFSDIVVDTVPNIQSLKIAYKAMSSISEQSNNSSTKAYYDVIREKVFKDYPIFEISCCNNEAILFPFVSEAMLGDYVDTCRYFKYDKSENGESETKTTSLWYIKSGKDERFSLLYRPKIDIPEDKVYFRYRVWRDVRAFNRFTETMGPEEWKDQKGKQYSSASLLESEKFYTGCRENVEEIL